MSLVTDRRKKDVQDVLHGNAQTAVVRGRMTVDFRHGDDFGVGQLTPV